jgi:hypothetical protein
MTDVLLDPPSIPMTDSVSLYHGQGDGRWHSAVTTTRGDLLTIRVEGPKDERTYKAFVGVVRATVMAMNALGAAIDDAAKDTEG